MKIPFEKARFVLEIFGWVTVYLAILTTEMDNK